MKEVDDFRKAMTEYFDGRYPKKDHGYRHYIEFAQINLIILKLFNLISWTWWEVLAPTWITATIAGTILLLALAWRKLWKKK